MRGRTPLVAAVVGLMSVACQIALTSQPAAAELSCNGAGTKCRVTITSVDSATHKGTVDFEGLKLQRGFHNIHVYWALPANCFFNAGGDGVFFKAPADDDGQFFERFATDDENDRPTPNPRNGKKYHWKAKNDSNPGHLYRYKIVFHCGSGSPYVVDPWIQNG